MNNNQRDGSMTYEINPEPVNYSPNSLNHNQPLPADITVPKPVFAKGYIARTPIVKTDDYTQAGERYRSLSPADKQHLAENIAVELAQCRRDIIERVLSNFAKASKDWANNVMYAMQKCSK